MRVGRSFFTSLSLAALAACDSTSSSTTNPPPGCALEGKTFEVGGDGHPDVFGAKAAGQARAAKITDLSSIPQPAHGRQRIEAGDFVLANERIAVTIEAAQPPEHPSDGYGRFGGEILALDLVGDDGRPLGLSTYNETLMGIQLSSVAPTSVSVLKDGSDGAEAVVRVTGPLEVIPFLGESLGAIFDPAPPVLVAYDYTLRPGANEVELHIGILNATDVDYDIGATGNRQFMLGTFQGSRNQLVTAEKGFADPTGMLDFIGFDGELASFALYSNAAPLEYGIAQSGFALFWAPGTTSAKCTQSAFEFGRLVVAGPEYDDLGEALREARAEAPWRTISGTLTDGDGQPVEGAWVHEVGVDGAYLSRTKTDAAGAFVLHAPADDVTLIPQQRGKPSHPGALVGVAETVADLSFAANGRIQVTAIEQGGGAIPVRVQVIPTAPDPATPAAFGVEDEANARLHQAFALDGTATLEVPPGEHRVVVSRGYEWELHDETVTVAAGQTTSVSAALVHSVDTTGSMCGDFHIHSWHSADSNDRPRDKVAQAVADGLEIPCSSEHEWTIDFQPIVEDLGLEAWAFGMQSQELTTFTWGHFGVVPLTTRQDRVNNGAVDWVGKLPKEVFSIVQALPEDPVLIVNHPSGSGFGAFFSAASFDTKTGIGKNLDLWDENFDAIEVFNDSSFDSNREDSVADWFALLNRGKKYAAVGSSDSHHIRSSPVGYPRTCMYFGHDDPKLLSPEAVRDALGAAHSVISGGYSLSVTGPGGELPGDTISGGAATFHVVVATASWLPAPAAVEVIVNGVTVDEIALVEDQGPGPGRTYTLDVPVTVDGASPWVVFHVAGTGDLAPLHPGRQPFAVSNPIFFSP